MAAVKINTGEAYHEDRLAESPRDKWTAIIAERRYYLKTNIDYDCRCLVQYVAEAEEFYAELGYESAEAMVLEAYDIQPEQAWAAVAYLQGRGCTGPIGLAEAADQVQPSTKHGEIGNGRADESRVADRHSKPANKVSSESWDRILPRIARDAPEILDRVKAGEFRSARAAAIEAGIIKPVPTIRLVEDLAKVAAGIRKHLTAEQVQQLVLELTGGQP
jgi:hypothetical protein